MRAKRLLLVPLVASLLAGTGAGAALADATVLPVLPETSVPASAQVMLAGTTTASYFWDDSSGRAGDTGLPASGKPMQKGLFASPSWPLGTEGYVFYGGKMAKFFIGDRGPGNPSSSGVMLDIDAKTFAELTGGEFNPGTLMVNGNNGAGHIDVSYVITNWGDGLGKKDYPVSFSAGAWRMKDETPAEPRTLTPAMIEAVARNVPLKDAARKALPTPSASPSAGGRSVFDRLAQLVGVGAAGGAYLGLEQIRKLLSHR
ncbi:hypothetical protein [Microtetraspora sp. NBRC 13810]|uniref:hypothetical protein n=1 Tax=Microtetraspora sp. NBRC 13810 TaxID=3030990 RepID=UPI00333221EE